MAVFNELAPKLEALRVKGGEKTGKSLKNMYGKVCLLYFMIYTVFTTVLSDL